MRSVAGAAEEYLSPAGKIGEAPNRLRTLYDQTIERVRQNCILTFKEFVCWESSIFFLDSAEEKNFIRLLIITFRVLFMPLY